MSKIRNYANKDKFLHIFFQLIFFFSFVAKNKLLLAQTAEIANLQAKLIPEKADSLRIDAMFLLVLRYLQKNPDSSTYFAEIALQLAQKINDEQRQAAVLHQIGQAKQYTNQHTKRQKNFSTKP